MILVNMLKFLQNPNISDFFWQTHGMIFIAVLCVFFNTFNDKWPYTFDIQTVGRKQTSQWSETVREGLWVINSVSLSQYDRELGLCLYVVWKWLYDSNQQLLGVSLQMVAGNIKTSDQRLYCGVPGLPCLS